MPFFQVAKWPPWNEDFRDGGSSFGRVYCIDCGLPNPCERLNGRLRAGAKNRKLRLTELHVTLARCGKCRGGVDQKRLRVREMKLWQSGFQPGGQCCSQEHLALSSLRRFPPPRSKPRRRRL